MITRLTLLLAAALSLSSAFAEPKKLLVVTVTTGFRHSSIETAEKVLAELGAKSGAFTVDYVHQPEGQPKNPGKPPVKGEKDTDESFKAKQEAYSIALAKFNEDNKVWGDKIKAYMAEQMAIDKIKDYDGFVFANTTGDLQLPDRDGFIKLIEGGKAFIAMHSGSDTYHPFRGYIDMLGGEFETHKSQVEIQPILHSPGHPITKIRSHGLEGLRRDLHHQKLRQSQGPRPPRSQRASEPRATERRGEKEGGRAEALLPRLLVQRVRRRPGLLQLPRPS
jgi:hypothetical protein